jgi:RNA-binding protein YhbY
MPQSHLQIGKNGITKNFVKTLKGHFENHDSVKVSVLKSAGHSKEKVNEYAEELLNSLGKRYTAKVVGFTIFLKRWRKEIR